MTRTIEPPETPPREGCFVYEGHRMQLHPKVNEIGTPKVEDDFRTLAVVLESPARQIRLLHARWGADVADQYWAFERGMRRRSKKGQPRWMRYNLAVDQVPFAIWFLREWIKFLDKTKPIKLYEPRSAKCFEKMPIREPIANAEAAPEGGLFSVFKA